MKNGRLGSIVGIILVNQIACSANDDSLGIAGSQGTGRGGAAVGTAGTGGSLIRDGNGGASVSQQGGAAGVGNAADSGGQGGKAGTHDASVPQSDVYRDVAGGTDVVGLGGGMGSGGSTGTTDAGTMTGGAKGRFPRADGDPSLETVSGSGSYQYQSYSTGFPIAGSAFSSATIFYPTNAEPPFVAVALCPGFTEVEAGFLTWGQLLASHGIVALIMTPLNTFLDSPEARGDQLLAALDTLTSENSRADSALNGKIATDRLGVMGHSMGGGGTLFACNKGSSRIKAAFPLMPWQPGGTFPSCTAPTLLVAAENDALVSPDLMAYPEYQSLTATDKVYMEVARADHTSGNDVSGRNNLYARYAVSWFKLHLESDSRYAKFVSGDAHKADVAAGLFVKFEP